ncbi:MAG: hypothetical protein RR178_10240, partial [Gordonibacter sp.]
FFQTNTLLFSFTQHFDLHAAKSTDWQDQGRRQGHDDKAYKSNEIGCLYTSRSSQHQIILEIIVQIAIGCRLQNIGPPDRYHDR